MSKSEQILWIVKWYFDSDHQSLDAHDFGLQCEFEAGTGIEVNHNVWRSRIRDAAKEIGLTGWRSYNAESSPGAGIPRYTMIYS